MEGSPLSIKGVADLDITLLGMTVNAQFLVATSMSAKAIVGLDFLQNNHCVLNLDQQVLHLKGKAIPLNKDSSGPPDSPHSMMVKTSERLTIPPFSGIEAMVQTSLIGTTDHNWLVEPAPQETFVMVARAVVCPCENGGTIAVPVRLINPSPQTVNVPRGTKVAQVTKLDHMTTISTVGIEGVTNAQSSKEVSVEKQKGIWNLVTQSDKTLSEAQQQKLYHVLLEYADVFAVSDTKLGRTNTLTHTIHTGSGGPIRQQVRRTQFTREMRSNSY